MDVKRESKVVQQILFSYNFFHDCGVSAHEVFLSLLSHYNLQGLFELIKLQSSVTYFTVLMFSIHCLHWWNVSQFH